LALAGGGDVAEAGKAITGFLKDHPKNYHALVAQELQGDLLVAFGKYDDALKSYGEVAKAPFPEYQMRAAVATGRALAAQKKFPEALAKFEAADQLAATAGPQGAKQKLAATLGRANCMAETGQADQAIALVEEVISQADAEEADLLGPAYVTLGNCYRKKPDGVKQALLSYLKVDVLYSVNGTAHAEALANLMELWAEVGKPERALEASEVLKSKYANSVWAKK